MAAIQTKRKGRLRMFRGRRAKAFRGRRALSGAARPLRRRSSKGFKNALVRISRSAPQYSRSYRHGFAKGREDGFQRGIQDGVQQGIQHTVLPLALIVPVTPDAPSLDMMVLQPMSLLKNLGIYNFRIRTEQSVTPEDVDAAAIVIFVRNFEPEGYRVMQWAQERGKPTVYCIDDYYHAIPPVDGLSEYLTRPDRLETYSNYMRNATIVKVDSPYFAEMIRMHFNTNVVCFPSGVDFAAFEQGGKPERNDGKIVIGYEGTYKEHDFTAVLPAIQRILAEYAGKVRFEFHGFIPQSLIGKPDVLHIPFEFDKAVFARQMYQFTWDIGLAPLEESVFNACKANLKFKDYATCWIPGIYSRSPVYLDCVAHGETGYVVDHTPEGWYAGMKQMIDDAGLRSRIKEQAGQFVRQHFTIDTCAARWREAILRR